MTLFKELLIVICLLFTFLFLSTFFVSLYNTHLYLNRQLQTNAQDTATSLGLSLSPYMEKKDTPTMVSMIMAIFDRGYFERIQLSAMDGKPLVERYLPVKVKDVPTWFVKWVSLEGATEEALVMSQWRQAGKISVKSNPGFAYIVLWNSSLEILKWFLGFTVFFIFLGAFAIRFLLNPLKAISEQAEAICNREFPILKNIPHTFELRRVTQAMNKMSLKLREMFEKQAVLTNDLRKQAFQDDVTGLANRHYFDNHLDNLVKSPEAFFSGALIFIELKEFNHFNDMRGFEAGDILLLKIAKIIQEIFKKVPEYFAAHISGGIFAVILPHTEKDEVAFLSKKLMGETADILKLESTTHFSQSAHIGAAFYYKGMSVDSLLSAADMALRAAQSEGDFQCHLHDPDTEKAKELHTLKEWHILFEEDLLQDKVVQYYQAVRDCETNKLLHHEVLLRIKDANGELLSAGTFITLAEKDGVAHKFDQLVIEHLIRELETHKTLSDHLFAVNLSNFAIAHSTFTDWLIERLLKSPTVAKQFIFEISEFSVIQHLNETEAFIKRLSQTGSQFALDHFGRNFSAFGYLNRLKLAYVKIDGGYTRNLIKNKDNQFFIRSIVDIAHTLDIRVIAENVETAEELMLLSALGVEGAQGVLIGKPHPIDFSNPVELEESE